MARTPAQIGKANRRNGRDAERKVRDWLRPRGWPELDYTHAGGPTRAHADDRGDLAPCIDRDGDHWTIQVKGPRSQPSPGEVERWAAETAAQADANGRAAPTRPALDPRQGRGASNPWADTHPPRDLAALQNKYLPAHEPRRNTIHAETRGCQLHERAGVEEHQPARVTTDFASVLPTPLREPIPVCRACQDYTRRHQTLPTPEQVIRHHRTGKWTQRTTGRRATVFSAQQIADEWRTG